MSKRRTQALTEDHLCSRSLRLLCTSAILLHNPSKTRSLTTAGRDKSCPHCKQNECQAGSPHTLDERLANLLFIAEHHHAPHLWLGLLISCTCTHVVCERAWCWDVQPFYSAQAQRMSWTVFSYGKMTLIHPASSALPMTCATSFSCENFKCIYVSTVFFFDFCCWAATIIRKYGHKACSTEHDDNWCGLLTVASLASEC